MSDSSAPLDIDALLLSLRRKEGAWVDWAKACQQLHKAGVSPQAIFEATGFEQIQQNQIMVGVQVYEGLVSLKASPAVLEYFGHKGSDILYEFRILNQPDRVPAAELIVNKALDSDDAHEIARAVKAIHPLHTLPEGFSSHPGDAVAYQMWQAAQQTPDLQERARLIAKGLKYVHSASARQALETLLTTFAVGSRRPAPTLPIYRLDRDDDQLPRIVPVVGQLPLTKHDLMAVPLIEETGTFRMITFSGQAAWVALPGWSVIANAVDPVGLLLSDQDLRSIPHSRVTSLSDDDTETVLAVVERSRRDWQPDAFVLVEQDQQLAIHWFEAEPQGPILGHVLLIIRPARIMDEGIPQDLWQLEDS